MIYHSTRSLENGVNAREALLKGLCDDGGLYVSDELLTCVLTPDMLKGLTYRETALRVIPRGNPSPLCVTPAKRPHLATHPAGVSTSNSRDIHLRAASSSPRGILTPVASIPAGHANRTVFSETPAQSPPSKPQVT